MKVAILEIGDYHESADVKRVFSSMEKAKENTPAGFKEQAYIGMIYLDEANERWLTIREFEVE